MVKMANLKPYFKQRGATLIMTAFLLPVMFAALGGALDLGNLYVYKSQLQNVADSAALAGIERSFAKADYAALSQSLTYRLIEDPDVNESDAGDTSGQQAEFTLKLDDDMTYSFYRDENTDTLDRNASDYVDVNTSGDRKLSLTDQKKANTDATKLWVARNNSNNPVAFCYRVQLENTIPTYFIRFFGIDELTVDANAVALVYISGSNKTPDEVIQDTAKDIAETIPNYYWETLVGNSFSVDNTDPSVMDIKIRKTGFGKRKAAYFTTDWDSYIKDITTFEEFSDSIIAYKDRDYIGQPHTNPNDKSETIIDYSETAGFVSDRFCAEPIYVDDDGKKDMSKLQNLVYTLDATLMQKGDDGKKEITGLFLDRPNIGATNAKTVRGTVLNIKSDTLSKDNTTPLYMRFESEPIKFASSSTFAQPITINVKGYQEKPMIIAYDGPDPNRTLKDVPKTDIKNPTAAWNHDTERVLSTERLTTATYSPPYTINLNADFNGVIYAPFSTVTINGTGKINGFVLAARIIDNGATSTRTKLTSSKVKLPIWGAKHDGNNKFSYTVTYIEDTYMIVYDTLKYYTNQILIKS